MLFQPLIGYGYGLLFRLDGLVANGIARWVKLLIFKTKQQQTQKLYATFGVDILALWSLLLLVLVLFAKRKIK